MAKMHDATLRKDASGCHDRAELEKTARKMVESNLELAGSVEKVGVAPDPKRGGLASWNLEHS